MRQRLKSRLLKAERSLQAEMQKRHHCDEEELDQFIKTLRSFETEVWPLITGGPSLSEALRASHLRSTAEQLIPKLIARDRETIERIDEIRQEWGETFSSLAADRAKRAFVPPDDSLQRESDDIPIEEFRTYGWSRNQNTDPEIGVLCRIRSLDLVEAEACRLIPPFLSVETVQRSEDAAIDTALCELVGESEISNCGQLSLIGSKHIDCSS